MFAQRSVQARLPRSQTCLANPTMSSIPLSSAPVAARVSSHAGLSELIQTKRAIVGVIGLGYVGLPLIRAFTSAGFRCLGFDVDQTKVHQLNAGQSYIKHIDSAAL